MRRRTVPSRRSRYGLAVLALILAALLGGSQPAETYPIVDDEGPFIAAEAAWQATSETTLPGLQVAIDPVTFRETTLWGAALHTLASDEGFLQGVLAAFRPSAYETGDRGSSGGVARGQPAEGSGYTRAGVWLGGPRLLTYEIKAGDTLWSLAERYGTDVDTLLRINNLKSPHRLRLGQKIRILTVPGLVHRVRRGESVEKIAQTYKISPAAIIMANDIDDPDHIRVGQELILPGAVPPPPPKPTRQLKSRTAAANQARAQEKISREKREDVAARGGIPSFTWPVAGPISSYYGPRWGMVHEGIDIAVPTGTPVRAAAGGQVVYAGTYGSYGKLVILDHGNGITTRYGHNSRILVTVGERVERGDVIARSGNTGRSTGPHVHFEIRKDGRPLNPLGYLPQ
ncbi:MAG: M23 family metallopeptidase [Limnochordales bacterium]|nr:M23 family metallopeptidase [Limnochordales bacterium]